MMQFLPSRVGTGWRLGAGLLVGVLVAAAPAPTPAAILDQLKVARSDAEAATLEGMLQTALYAQATAAVQVLMDASVAAIHAGRAQDALANADAAIELQPALAELWRRRAEARFAGGDEKGAFIDLAQALSREPRLISAWADVSRFSEARKDYKRALEAWQKLLELDPHTDKAKSHLDFLQRKANGQPI